MHLIIQTVSLLPSNNSCMKYNNVTNRIALLIIVAKTITEPLLEAGIMDCRLAPSAEVDLM
jgi:hypothetical protein